MEDFKTYDGLLNVALINLCSLSKETNSITLDNFNSTDKSHLTILKVALITHELFDKTVLIKTSLWNYIIFKLKYRYKNVHWYRKKYNTSIIELTDFITHIETANNQINAFSKIYDLYYNKRKGK